MGGQENSPSSSTDSSSHPSLCQQRKRDLSTDLRLGLRSSISSQQDSSSIAREQLSDWPPIMPLLRSTLVERQNQRCPATFFVKVHMEGIPIGRKLDLFAHNGYDGLIRTLRRMFKATILCPGLAQVSSNKTHVLTYEDKEGDWMMVGDVPWELFMTTVKKLKIARADKF